MTTAKPNWRLTSALLFLTGVLTMSVGAACGSRSPTESAPAQSGAPPALTPTTVSTLVAASTQRTPAAPGAETATEVSATVTHAATRVATRAATRAVTATRSLTAEVSTPATATSAVAVPAVPVTAADGTPVRFVFPDLKIDTGVVPMGWQVVQGQDGPVSEWVIPENEAGHHINSAHLGEPGNLVISGHNNVYARVFRPISLAWNNDARQPVDDYTDSSDVLNGRRIMLYDANGQQYDYTITEFYRLEDTGAPVAQRIANARYMQPTADTRLTVVTCWPPTNNTHRLILIAVPAEQQ